MPQPSRDLVRLRAPLFLPSSYRASGSETPGKATDQAVAPADGGAAVRGLGRMMTGGINGGDQNAD